MNLENYPTQFPSSAHTSDKIQRKQVSASTPPPCTARSDSCLERLSALESQSKGAQRSTCNSFNWNDKDYRALISGCVPITLYFFCVWKKKQECGFPKIKLPLIPDLLSTESVEGFRELSSHVGSEEDKCLKQAALKTDHTALTGTPDTQWQSIMYHADLRGFSGPSQKKFKLAKNMLIKMWSTSHHISPPHQQVDMDYYQVTSVSQGKM